MPPSPSLARSGPRVDYPQIITSSLITVNERISAHYIPQVLLLLLLSVARTPSEPAIKMLSTSFPFPI